MLVQEQVRYGVGTVVTRVIKYRIAKNVFIIVKRMLIMQIVVHQVNKDLLTKEENVTNATNTLVILPKTVQ